MNKLIILSTRECDKLKHVSYNTILGMENEFLENKNVRCYNFSKYYSIINKIIHKITNRWSVSLPDEILLKQINRSNSSICFFAAMSFNEILRHKNTLKRIKIPLMVYCFDTWESTYSSWLREFEIIKPTYIVCTYKKSVDYFSKFFKNVFWVQQSMNKKYFHDYGEKKDRLFMQMGRRNPDLHQFVLDYLNKKFIKNENEYMYEKHRGNIVFPDTVDLAKNINKTKFFILAPQSLDNPQKTGNISEVTARFFEGMACKSLLVGFKPMESFDELFPYSNAMIEIKRDGSDFVEKIDYFNTHEDEYYKIINKNYEYVMQNQTWSNRLQEIFNVISDVNKIVK